MTFSKAFFTLGFVPVLKKNITYRTDRLFTHKLNACFGTIFMSGDVTAVRLRS